MAITTEIMVIIMDINDITHKTINFKKRKVMDDFNRNLIITGIFMDFCWNLIGFMYSNGNKYKNNSSFIVSIPDLLFPLNV